MRTSAAISSMLPTLAGLLLYPMIAAPTQTPNSSRESLALVGGTVYVSPGDAPISNGVVLIQDGVIVAAGTAEAIRIPGSARVLDCTGLAITAGFWNSHVHFTEKKWANAAQIPATELDRQFQDMVTRYGFTSVFDLSSPWENTQRLRERIDSGEMSGPRIRSTGEGLIPPGAIPPDIVTDMMGWMSVPLPEVAHAAEAATVARKLLDRGADGIKLFASAPSGAMIPPGAIEAAVGEAHLSEKPVFVHPNTELDVLTAVRSGVDVIAHTTPRSGAWDETVLEAIGQRRVALIPTLWLWKYYARHERQSTQDAIETAEVRQLRSWLDAGGEVLFGTDLGAVDPDPAEEYRLMTQAGMSFPEILASLTTSPAEWFGESTRLGRISPGMQADLVVLNADPSEDIRALSDVRYTLRDGIVIYSVSE